MILISQRLKRTLWAAIVFTVIAAIPGVTWAVFIVFASSFIVWWLAFKTDKRQIWRAVWVGLAIAVLAVLLVLGIGSAEMRGEFLDMPSDILIVFYISMAISLISIPISIVVHIFQTEPTAAGTTLPKWILKAVILVAGVSMLFFVDGRIIATSISPSEKITFQMRKSCCLICPSTTAIIRLNKGLRKGYSETCVIAANASEPIASSQFSWNSDETIVSWKSSDNSMGEIDLRKDCGTPVVPSSLDDGDPRKFVFISPSGNKVLFRKRTCLVSPCKEISALRVRWSDGTGWNSYYCNLHIPNGTQPHGASMRTEDIPDNVVIAPGIRWDKNETVAYSAFQSPPFSFDLREACNWK